MEGTRGNNVDTMPTGATTFVLELRPQIPPRLARLPELAGNLAYSWDRDIRGVFWRLDRDLWAANRG